MPSLLEIERPEYNVTEGDGQVEICVVISEPADPTTLETTYSALLRLSTLPETATGMGTTHFSLYKTNLFSLPHTVDEDYGDFSEDFMLTPTSPRQCFNISIVDDTILETPETFLGLLSSVEPLPPAATLGITETTVTIFDDEGVLNTPKK